MVTIQGLTAGVLFWTWLWLAAPVKAEPLDPQLLAQAVSPTPQQTAEVLSQAREAANLITDPAAQANVLSEIASRYAAIGQNDTAVQVLSQALQIANSLEAPSAKADLLSEIATRYAAIGQTDTAVQILSQALQVANSLEDTSAKASALSAIATRYTALGRTDTAAEILSQALSETALKSANTGQVDTATQLLSRAVEVANLIQDVPAKASVLSEIATNYTQIGQADRGSQILSRALDVASSTPQVASGPQFLTPSPLRGKVSFSGNLNTGLTTIRQVGLAANATQQWSRERIETSVNVSNNFDSGRDTLPEQFFGDFNGQYQHYVANFSYIFLRLRTLRDINQEIRLQASAVPGFGWNLWRVSDLQTFDLQAGLGLQYNDTGLSSSDRETEFTPLPQLGLTYRNLFFDNVRFSQQLTLSAPTTQTNNYTLESTTAFSIPFSQQWALTNSLGVKLTGEPAENVPQLNVTFGVGLEYSF